MGYLSEVRRRNNSSARPAIGSFLEPNAFDNEFVGTIPDQPGPTDAAGLKFHTGAQYPAGAAESALESVQRRADRTSTLLTELGLEVPDEVGELRERGFVEPKPGIFERLVSIIDGP